jgi:hypothetical protein
MYLLLLNSATLARQELGKHHLTREDSIALLKLLRDALQHYLQGEAVAAAAQVRLPRLYCKLVLR